MDQIEGPTTFRPMSRWAFIGFCCRHPILAIFARSTLPDIDPLTEREQTLFIAAIVHGLVAWMLFTHT